MTDGHTGSREISANFDRPTDQPPTSHATNQPADGRVDKESYTSIYHSIYITVIKHLVTIHISTFKDVPVIYFLNLSYF